MEETKTSNKNKSALDSGEPKSQKKKMSNGGTTYNKCNGRKKLRERECREACREERYKEYESPRENENESDE